MAYARVQNALGGVNATSLTVTLAAGPTTGNLLVAWANSDATVTQGGTGWTAGPSVIDGNGTYMWWKVAGASEASSLTFTPSISTYICAGLLEYSGNTASPLDQSSSSTHSGTAVSSSTAVTVTTASAHDLGISAGLLHASSPTATAPTAPTWTNGWSNVQSQGATAGSFAVYTFVGDNLDLGAAGSVSTAVSWSTNTWPDVQQLLMTFTASATPAGQWIPAVTTPNQGFF